MVCTLAALVLVGCHTTEVLNTIALPTRPDGQVAYERGYRLVDMLDMPRGQVLIALAFSGGGKRSSAFGHGVLKGLAEMDVAEPGGMRRLLDEVDYMSAVSGGSFPAAHYALYGDASFQTFPDDFLYRDVNSYIFGIYLLPWNWEWLVNPFFGTNDAMAAIYDRLMFHGATYGDLARRGLPFLSVNATDIANGTSFAFSQGNFDLLCANLEKYTLAQAVAASNGFPVLFSPITLASRRGDCGAGTPPLTPRPLGHPPRDETEERIDFLQRTTERYMDQERTGYVHLMDGGIADNLALRGLVGGMLTLGQYPDVLDKIARTTRRILVISVDGQAASDPSLGRERIVTSLGQIFAAVSGTQIDAYNFETLLLAQGQTKELVDRVITARCQIGRVIGGHDCHDVAGAFVHLSLDDVPDAAARRRLQAIPTGLTIPKEDADALVGYGVQVVKTNPVIQHVLTGL